MNCLLDARINVLKAKQFLSESLFKNRDGQAPVKEYVLICFSIQEFQFVLAVVLGTVRNA